MLDLFPTAQDFHLHNFPAIGCRQGSAWHDWSKCGALFAMRNPDVVDTEEFADKFALGCDNTFRPQSAAYKARRNAFMFGTRHHKLLTNAALTD